jgi:F0F1-type ATP synthase assembly protein I
MGSKTKLRLAKYKQRVHQASPYMRTLHAFNALSLVGGILYGLYYGIFLYKNTFSLSVLAMDGLLGGLGGWLGYILGVVIIRRFGYGFCLRAAFGIMAAVSFFTALVAGSIADWFMILAVFKALPVGMYAAAVDAIMLREVASGSRDGFLQIKLAFEFLAGIMLPSIVGALISQAHGYELAFILSGLIYVVALCVPVKLPKPDVSLNLREIANTFKRPFYKRHAANRTVAAGFNQLNGFVLMIIPFLMLQDELKVGLLTSGIACLAGIVSLLVRKIRPRQKLKFGYVAYTVRGLASMLFISFWSAHVLMIWQLVNKLATPLHDPLQQSLDIHNDSLIMGEDLQKKALHINLLNNTLLLIGTTFAYGVFYLLTKTAPGQQQLILQLLIMSFASWRFINLTLSVRINEWAQSRATQFPVLQ